MKEENLKRLGELVNMHLEALELKDEIIVLFANKDIGESLRKLVDVMQDINPTKINETFDGFYKLLKESTNGNK